MIDTNTPVNAFTIDRLDRQPEQDHEAVLHPTMSEILPPC